MKIIPGDFILDPSLVLYLPLHQLDGASFMSRDAYGHLCTVTGALWRPNGRWFDGSDDYIDCGNAVGLQLLNSFSVLSWIYIDTLTPTDGHLAIASKRTYHVSGFYIIVEKTSGIVKVFFNFGGGESTLATAEGLDAGVWYLVAVTYDGTTGKIYVNGVEKATGTPTYTADTTRTVKFGRREDGFGDFPGKMGNLFVYNRCLIPLEIEHNYLATKWRYQ